MKKYIKQTEKLHTLQSAKADSTFGSKSTPLFPIAIQPPLHSQKHNKKKSEKSPKSKKHKKEKSKKRKSRSRSPDESRQSDEKRQKLLRLRAERLKREEVERNRAKLLLAKYAGTVDAPRQAEEPGTARSSSLAPSVVQQPVRVKQKYNSQFNPEIAKQNYEDVRRH